MSYVNVEAWVPDTVDGPVVSTLQLKACDTCRALVPVQLMSEHEAAAHPPPPEVTPH